MNLYNKVEKFVIESFEKTGNAWEIPHAKRTAYWIKNLKPNADETYLIAAISHDIERAFGAEKRMARIKDLEFNDPEYIKPHEKKGAEIIAEFLEKNGADQKTIKKVYDMILKHEEGGTKDQDLLKNADSLSFFDGNHANNFMKRISDLGKRKVQAKIDWMYQRITSEKAKTIARPLYEQVIKKLEAI